MKNLIALIALSMGLAHAGDMHTTVDNFTGEVETRFVGVNDGAIFIIGRISDKTALLMVRPNRGVTDCTRYPMLVKTADSKIHTLKTHETDSRACGVLISPQLLKGGVMVRMPMYNQGNIDVTIDTAKLDWASMGKRKAEQ
jgi:hypothetical protein